MDIKQNESDILEVIYNVKNFLGSSISVTFNTEKQYNLVKKVFRYSNNNYLKPKAVYKLIIKDRNELTIEELLRYLIGLRDYIFRQSKIKIPKKIIEPYYINEIELEEDKTRIRRLRNDMKKSLKEKKTIKRGHNGLNEFIIDIELYFNKDIKFGYIKNKTSNPLEIISDWKRFNGHFDSTPKEEKSLFKKLLKDKYSDSYIDRLFSDVGED